MTNDQLVLTARNERAAEQLKMDILRLARDGNLDSAAVALALADVLALTAAALDLRDGTRTLPDRMGAVWTRIEQTYERRLQGVAPQGGRTGGLIV